MPNRKTDTNNRLGFSNDFIGQKDVDYPKLRGRLIADGQVLEWQPAAR